MQANWILAYTLVITLPILIMTSVHNKTYSRDNLFELKNHYTACKKISIDSDVHNVLKNTIYLSNIEVNELVQRSMEVKILKEKTMH